MKGRELSGAVTLAINKAKELKTKGIEKGRRYLKDLKNDNGYIAALKADAINTWERSILTKNPDMLTVVRDKSGTPLEISKLTENKETKWALQRDDETVPLTEAVLKKLSRLTGYSFVAPQTLTYPYHGNNQEFHVLAGYQTEKSILRRG